MVAILLMSIWREILLFSMRGMGRRLKLSCTQGSRSTRERRSWRPSRTCAPDVTITIAVWPFPPGHPLFTRSPSRVRLSLCANSVRVRHVRVWRSWGLNGTHFFPRLRGTLDSIAKGVRRPDMLCPAAELLHRAAPRQTYFSLRIHAVLLTMYDNADDE